MRHSRIASPPPNRLGLVAGLLLLALPALAQYNAYDITPPSSNSGKLNGAASGKQVGGGGNGHAYLLNGNALTSVDLHPLGWTSSMATSTDDVQQCGYGYSPVTGGSHALLWSGSSATYVDIHALFNFSYCLGVHGGQQVGYGERPVYFTTYQHALLWTGSSASAVDLHPLAYLYSKALGVHDGQQVGYASTLPYPYGDTLAYQAGTRALLWTGTAASVVELHPTGYDGSQALATNGFQQGGWGYLALGNSHLHAMMWSGTAASAVDLHPAAYTDSRITAMTLTRQVGDGWIGAPGAPGSVRHALVWSGTADSVIDLNQYIPAGYTHAVATGIDLSGNVVGYAYNTFTQGTTIPPDAIAVVFAPGAAAPSTPTSIVLSSGNVAPGTTVQGTVSIAAAAPAAGVTLSFFSTNVALLPTPASVTIPAGQTSATFSFLAGGATLQGPSSARLYVTDGVTSKAASLIVTPVVNLSTVTINAVEGGFSTTGTITLSIPAQAGGATITLTNGNPALATLPATVFIAQGFTTGSFSVTTTAVTTATTVPVTAALNGRSVAASVTLSPAPVVSLSALAFSFPSVVGGQSITGTVTVNNFPRGVEGAVVTLSSGDTNTLQIPATVTIPQGMYSVSFTATTVLVNGTKGVSVKAVYNGSNLSTTIQVVPTPTVTIIQADYYTDTNMFKVAATTTFANSILTYGTDPNLAPIGTMQIEAGVFKGSTIMLTAPPAFATVWNSNGGQATIAVTQRLSTAVGGGGGGGTGGGGGGGTTTAAPKLTVNKSSKGNITSNPLGISCGSNGNSCTVSFVSGTTVTLTATPDFNQLWVGWTGACTGNLLTCTVVMTADKSVTANFK